MNNFNFKKVEYLLDNFESINKVILSLERESVSLVLHCKTNYFSEIELYQEIQEYLSNDISFKIIVQE